MTEFRSNSDSAQSAIGFLRSTSLTSLVQEEIVRMILSGELDAGAQVKEFAIADRLGVGRSSVREAFRALEEAGLVRLEKNRGVFVRRLASSIGPDSVNRITSLYRDNDRFHQAADAYLEEFEAMRNSARARQRGRSRSGRR